MPWLSAQIVPTTKISKNEDRNSNDGAIDFALSGAFDFALSGAFDFAQSPEMGIAQSPEMGIPQAPLVERSRNQRSRNQRSEESAKISNRRLELI